MKQSKKPKQTLESAQYGLEINFKDDKKLLSVHFLQEYSIYYLCIPMFDLHFKILLS